MSAKREIAAHHEVGHAVVALAFGATGECRRSSRDRARWDWDTRCLVISK
jgi:hypothetical protein